MRILLSLALLASLTMAAPAFAQTPAADSFNAKQKEEIEKIVRELLTTKEPGIVMKAAQEQAKREHEEETKKASEAVSKNRDKLANNPLDPVAGNPKGDVTVVEFFDYNCGYCKKALPTVEKLLEEDKNVKVVFKEYPILSDSSRLAARAALAANKQKKYFEMHQALMAHKGGYTDASLLEVATKVGLNKDQFKKDYESAEIAKQIEDDQALGNEIGARGTPTFIINDKVVPGAMEYNELKDLVAAARKPKT